MKQNKSLKVRGLIKTCKGKLKVELIEYLYDFGN